MLYLSFPLYFLSYFGSVEIFLFHLSLLFPMLLYFIHCFRFLPTLVIQFSYFLASCIREVKCNCVSNLKSDLFLYQVSNFCESELFSFTYSYWNNVMVKVTSWCIKTQVFLVTFVLDVGLLWFYLNCSFWASEGNKSIGNAFPTS